MVDLLREFIGLHLERLGGMDRAWNYWMRRPMNTIPPAGRIAPELGDMRQGQYSSVKDDFLDSMQKLTHDVGTAPSASRLRDILDRYGVSAEEIVSDPTMWERAVEEDDLQEMQRQLLDGFRVWARETVTATAGDGMNAASLQAMEYVPEVDPFE